MIGNLIGAGISCPAWKKCNIFDILILIKEYLRI